MIGRVLFVYPCVYFVALDTHSFLLYSLHPYQSYSYLIYSTGDDGACVKTSSTDVTYFPNPNFVGSDKCIYEACEFNMNTGEWFTDATCVQATIRITVSGPGIRGCPSPAPTTSPTAGAPTVSNSTTSFILETTTFALISFLFMLPFCQ